MMVRSPLSSIQKVESETFLPFGYQRWEFAIFANGVGVLTQVAHNLEQSLLRGSGRKHACGSPSKQTLTRQAQHRVIFGWRPGKITVLNDLFYCLIFPLDSANPEPRQNYVHGQVSHS